MKKGGIDKQANKRIFRYTVEAAIEQIKLNIRFPCKLSICWNYGEGSVTTVKPVSLEKGVAKFEQMLSYSVNVTFDEEKQQYLQQKTTLEVFIITQNGNSLAGFVTLDVGALIGNQQRKDVFQIQRCPDRSATVRMKLLYRFVSEKASKASNESHNYIIENSIIIPSQALTKTEHYNRKNDNSTRNKQLIQRELVLLKSRVNEYEGKYKSQKAQRDKLNDLLKGKQQVYFTLKTEIKRREIEMQGMARALDEYKNEYDRLKSDNQFLSKQRQRLQVGIQNLERSSYDRVSKLQNQNITYLKKLQKIGADLDRTKREKDSLVANLKQKNQGIHKDKQSLNQSLRQLRKQKQDAVKAIRIQKDACQRTIRDLNRRIVQYEQEINETQQKYSTVNKKISKIEQLRMQQMTRMNIKIVQLQKIKESLTIELSSIKKDTHKKQHNLSDTLKNIQKQLIEERTNNTRLTKSISDFQFEKTTAHKQMERIKQINKGMEQQKKKLEKQVEHLKYQINGLNEIMLGKSNQLKSLMIQGKQVQEQHKKKQMTLQQRFIENQQEFQRQLRELKKTQQNKYLTLTTNFMRKQRDVEDALIRQQKLNMHIQTLKDQYRKNQQLFKQKFESSRKNQQNMKQQYFEYSKKKQQQVQQLVQKMRQMQLQIYGLNQSLSQAKDTEFRLLQRQQRFKIQHQQLHTVYNELNLTAMRLRQQLQQARDALQNNERNQNQLNRQIESSQARYSKLVKELKDKILELQTDKAKLQNIIRQKQKSIDQNSKSSREEIESFKKQLQKRELEIKKLQDQNRDIVLKDKFKLDEIEMEYQKTKNQLIRATGSADRNKAQVEQLQNELRGYKENFKFITREKQDLIRGKQQAEADKRSLQQSMDSYEITLNTKDKQIRGLKVKIDQFELELKEYTLIRSKTAPIIQQLCQTLWRITDSQATCELTNQYDNMMQIRKGLLILQTKLVKQQQLSSDVSRGFQKQSQSYQGQIQRLNNDLLRLKAHVESLKQIQQDQITEINLLKIQNQDLMYQVNNLDTELVGLKSNNSVLDTKLKDQVEHSFNSQQQLKRVLEKYEGLLSQTRQQLNQKYQKHKKQLTSTIRTLESKIELLQQKNFSLQLQGQKIQQYVRREEEAKKVLARMYQLQRQNLYLLQIQKDIDQKALSQQGKLQWQKNSLQESMKSTILKLQKSTNLFQSELQTLKTKNKQLLISIKDKQAALQKSQRTILNLQQQFCQQRNQLQQEKDRISQSQNRLKNEISKMKSQLTLLKKSYEQDKEKLFSLESVSLIKNELDIQLQSKNAYIVELQDKQTKLNQDVFKLTQQIQQLKWEFNQTISSKETEIMNIQQELYTLNSKQNMRMLKQAEYIEKQRQLEQQKRNLLREIQDYKQKYKVLTDSRRSVQSVVIDLDKSRYNNVQNERKHQEIIKILEQEISNLKSQSNMMKR